MMYNTMKGKNKRHLIEMNYGAASGRGIKAQTHRRDTSQVAGN
jgi:hypothetical protein